MKNKVIDTVIVSGGNIQKDFALDFLKKIEENQKQKPYFIAADRGLDFFMEAGFLPDLVVGDFDSLPQRGKNWMNAHERMQVLQLKPEKDDSDTQSAVDQAIKKGSKNILLLGCTGTRLDHVIANMELLVYGQQRGIHLTLADQNNYIEIAENGTVLEKKQQFGKYVSVFPIGGDVENLTLTGFKYPLQNHHLRSSDSSLTVSNEITSDRAEIHYTSGTLLMIMSRD